MREPEPVQQAAHRGTVRPDPVFAFQRGALPCSAASSRDDDDPSLGDGRKNEGLDPRPRIVFGGF